MRKIRGMQRKKGKKDREDDTFRGGRGLYP